MEKLSLKILFLIISVCFVSCNTNKSFLKKNEINLNQIRLSVKFKKYQAIKYDTLNSTKYLYFDFDFINDSQRDSLIFYFNSKILSNTKIDYKGNDIKTLTPSYDCLVLESSEKEFRQFSTNYSRPTLVNSHKCFYDCRKKVFLKKGIPFNIQNYGIDKGNLLFDSKALNFRFHYFYYNKTNQLVRITSNWIKLDDILNALK